MEKVCIAIQDTMDQMAMVQFISRQVPKMAILSTIHCDHLTKPSPEKRKICVRPRT